MSYLLLGARGFIGRQVRTLLADGPDIDVVTVDLPGPAGVLDGDPPDLELDLAADGPERFAAVLDQVQPHAVVNCAGATTGTPEQLTAANVTLVHNLLAALETHGRTARLVHLGSAAEYGVTPTGQPVGEDAEPRPISEYGRAKLAGSQLVLDAAAAGRDAVVLRVFNPLGPGTPPTVMPGRLAAELARSARTGDRARMGNLDGHRDFIDVRDVAAAVLAAAAAGRPLPALLNIGSGEPTALRRLAALAADLVGVQPPLEEAGGSSRSAGVTWQQADISRAHEALDWSPRISLEQSLRDMGLIRPEAALR